jgi:hypothetical protein
MKMEKVTKVEMFEAIKAQLVDEAQIAFIDNEIRMVKAKNARRSNKPSKAQVANAELGAVVVAKLEADKRYTASEVQKAVEELTDLSNQRVSAILKALVKAGSVVRTEEKGKAYFSLA